MKLQRVTLQYIGPKTYIADSDFIVDNGQSREFISDETVIQDESTSILVDSNGYVYVGNLPNHGGAEHENSKIRKIHPNGQSHETFGPGIGTLALAADSNNNIYITLGLFSPRTLVKMTPDGTDTEIIVDIDAAVFALCIHNDYLYFWDEGNYVIWKKNVSGTEQIQFADFPPNGDHGLPGIGTFSERLEHLLIVQHIHVTSNNVLVFSTSYGYLYKIDLNGDNGVEFLGGDGGGEYAPPSMQDPHLDEFNYSIGNGASFRLGQIRGIASDDNNDIYVSSYFGYGMAPAL